MLGYWLFHIVSKIPVPGDLFPSELHILCLITLSGYYCEQLNVKTEPCTLAPFSGTRYNIELSSMSVPLGIRF